MDSDMAQMKVPEQIPKGVATDNMDHCSLDPGVEYKGNDIRLPKPSPKEVDMKIPDTMDLDPAFVRNEVHMKDTDTVGTMDTAHVRAPDTVGTIDKVDMKDTDTVGTMDMVHVRAPDTVEDMDTVHMKDPNTVGTMDTVNMKVPETVGTMDTAHVRVPDTNILEFPGELLVKILKFLNAGDISKLGETSHAFNKISKDPELWKKLIIDVAQINNHYQALEEVVKRATKLMYIKITDKYGEAFDEERFLNGMEPEENIDENGMAKLIKIAKATLKVLIVSNDDTIDGGHSLDIELKNKTIVKFGSLTELETIEVCGNSISRSGIRAIAKLKNLKVLKIPGWCCQIETKAMDLNYLFGELKNLREVDLSHHCVTNESLEILAHNNPNLEVLKLNNCEGLKRVVFDVGSSMPNLRWLSMKGTGISNKGLMNMVKNCTQLSHLDLKFCHNLKKDFLDIVKTNCPNLENLVLGYLGKPDILKRTDLSVFTTHFKKLRALDLTDCSHADEEFVQVMTNRGITIELHSDML